MSGTLRRSALPFVAALSVWAMSISAGSADAAPTQAASAAIPGWHLVTPVRPNEACAGRETTFHVKVASCLWLLDGHIHGYVGIDFLTGLNRSNVQRCKVFVQLKSSYKSLTQPVEFASCYDIAKRGGARWYTNDENDIDWGPGRRSGDVYYQYAWVFIETAVPYDGRDSAAVKSLTR